jgi:hypothetical protein
MQMSGSSRLVARLPLSEVPSAPPGPASTSRTCRAVPLNSTDERRSIQFALLAPGGPSAQLPFSRGASLAIERF